MLGTGLILKLLLCSRKPVARRQVLVTQVALRNPTGSSNTQNCVGLRTQATRKRTSSLTWRTEQIFDHRCSRSVNSTQSGFWVDAWGSHTNFLLRRQLTLPYFFKLMLHSCRFPRLGAGNWITSSEQLHPRMSFCGVCIFGFFLILPCGAFYCDLVVYFIIFL